MDWPPATTRRPALAEAAQGQRTQVISTRVLESLLVLFCLVLGTWRWWELGLGDFGFGSNFLADIVTVKRLVYKRQISGRWTLLGISFSLQPRLKQVGCSLPRSLPLRFSSRVLLVLQSTSQQFPCEKWDEPWVEEVRVLANQSDFKGR